MADSPPGAAEAPPDPCASEVGDLVPDHRVDEKGPNWSNLKTISNVAVNQCIRCLLHPDEAQDKKYAGEWTICDPNEREAWTAMEAFMEGHDAANAVVAVGTRSGVLKATKDGRAVLFLRMDHSAMTQWRARHCGEGTRHTDLSRSYVDLSAADCVHVMRATRLVQLEKDQVHHPDALAMLCLLMQADWIPKSASRPPKKIHITSLRLMLLPPLPALLEECFHRLGHTKTFSGPSPDDPGRSLPSFKWGQTGTSRNKTCLTPMADRFDAAFGVLESCAPSDALRRISPFQNQAGLFGSRVALRTGTPTEPKSRNFRELKTRMLDEAAVAPKPPVAARKAPGKVAAKQNAKTAGKGAGGSRGVTKPVATSKAGGKAPQPKPRVASKLGMPKPTTTAGAYGGMRVTASSDSEEEEDADAPRPRAAAIPTTAAAAAAAAPAAPAAPAAAAAAARRVGAKAKALKPPGASPTKEKKAKIGSESESEFDQELSEYSDTSEGEDDCGSGSGSESGSSSSCDSESSDGDEAERPPRKGGGRKGGGRKGGGRKGSTSKKVAPGSSASTSSTVTVAATPAASAGSTHLQQMAGPLRQRLRAWQERYTLDIPTEAATRIARDADAMQTATSDTAVHAASLSLIGALVDRLEAVMSQPANEGVITEEKADRIKEVAASAHELREAVLQDTEDLLLESKSMTARLENMLANGHRVLQTNTTVLSALVRRGRVAQLGGEGGAPAAETG
jgi:hypothetical protein